jgi:hypothetical protein
MGWTTTIYGSSPNFVADPNSIDRNTGRQVDWDKVTVAYLAGTSYTVTVNDADAAQGDTTLTVDALPVALPIGALLDFGTLAANAQVVTTTAQASAAAVSLAVEALTIAIPAGTILDFTGTGELAKVTADAAVGATSLTVEALDAQIESGDTANFPGTAQRMVAVVTVAAAAAATSLTVSPLAGPISDNATATYMVSTSHTKVIPAGTVVCQLSSGKIVPRAARPGSEEAIGILWSTASENSNEDALTGYGVIIGGVIYENLLPETITSYKTELETNGTTFAWMTYADTREV